MKFTPKKYQKRVTKFVLNNKRASVHVDMGLGKTVAVLTACKKLLDNFDVNSILVFAPLKVATLTWPDEIRKWDHLKDIDLAVVRGPEAERELILEEHHDICVINYEMTEWMVSWILKNRKTSPFDFIIFDESSKLKNHRSKRVKQLKPMMMSQMFPRAITMTGTPMPESYMDLWSQYLLIDKGESLGKVHGHFQSRYFEVNPYNRFDIKLRPGADVEIQDRIAPATITLMGEDYLNLPPVVVNDIMLELPDNARRIYDEFEHDMVALVEDEEIMAPSSGIVLEKCRQVACGQIYDSEKNVKLIHTEKFDYLEDMIETIGQNILVAYYYTFEEAQIRKRWPKAPILGKNCKDKEAKKALDNWNAGKVPVMFMHPLSVGHGINMQDGGSNLVFITPPWSNDAYDQTIHRLQRMGQESRVMVHRLIIRNSVDEIVYKALATKDTRQRTMMRALCSR